MAAGVLRLWTCRNSPVQHKGGGVRADAEVVLNEAGRAVLAELCGVKPAVLARALPAFTVDDPNISIGREAGLAQGRWRARWRAKRRSPASRAPRGAAGRRCGRCGICRAGSGCACGTGGGCWTRTPTSRWNTSTCAVSPRWWPHSGGGRAWRGVRCGPGWSREALYWEQEEIWPQRLHRVAGGNAGSRLGWWRIVGRDAVVLPEVVAVADALLDPAMAELVWRDSGAGRPRPLSADGAFCRRLGERVGRNWLGPLSAVDYGGPLLAWMGAVIRRRRGEGGPPGWRDDPWRLQREQQPATMAGGLRVMTAEAHSGGSATRWRASVSAEHRFHITQLVKEAGEQLVELRGVHSGTTAEVARSLLTQLSESAALIEKALVHTATAAVTAGVALEGVAAWARLPAHELAEIVAVGEDHG
ncbi:DNA-binding protein [Streptomyces europaeiscabiei]|uniref:DNA-binding protein n=1 Tax=Streptomyces europaeiscabiei TaxID=146819 RepID=UPI0029ACDD6F|nr:DNA-binding protein [Streptomyces europaeiscabiei]MDX2762921.1 DNA-binding protein [Streptomyces europaeiscabiei]